MPESVGCFYWKFIPPIERYLDVIRGLFGLDLVLGLDINNTGARSGHVLDGKKKKVLSTKFVFTRSGKIHKERPID
jgi:hypothetical protein